MVLWLLLYSEKESSFSWLWDGSKQNRQSFCLHSDISTSPKSWPHINLWSNLEMNSDQGLFHRFDSMASWKIKFTPKICAFKSCCIHQPERCAGKGVLRHTQRPTHTIQAHTHTTIDHVRWDWWFPIFYTIFLGTHWNDGTFAPRKTHICGVNTHLSSMNFPNFHGLPTSGTRLDVGLQTS